MHKNCLICGTSQADRAMIYRGEDVCSEGCRKLRDDEWTSEKYREQTGRTYNSETGLFDLRI